MKDSIVKMKLVEGAPMIGKLETTNDSVIIEVLIPGVSDGAISIEAEDDYISVELDTDYDYTKSFSIKLVGDSLVFKEFDHYKKNGILFLEIPIIQEYISGEPIKITV